VPLSAAYGFNIDPLKQLLVDLVPEGPAYFPKDQITDKSERFIAAEIIREQILHQYEQEIPYSIEVVVQSFKDEEEILKIQAEIWVMRDSQKGILVGKGGNEIKRLGIMARKNLESFFGKKIFLDTTVKVKENWRDSDLELTGWDIKSRRSKFFGLFGTIPAKSSNCRDRIYEFASLVGSTKYSHSARGAS
jgi:GTP-binding protein Era